ncbi:N-acetylmuramate alpha-1-phosphate uridylyltransferase MurU [uncultured Pseudoteredinibacter sp.]|uniref:N-acetylmuramate alpha-1-phosphate uridylyltransferase MurU n=1 Tax=uncultured Pseudoteredinibacter sp. TaxID=1641701 RepID=UPI00262AE4FA|nr:nucleotidyltransferase family protein [uncultured Pseudoteredinibacter sp.]
MKAMILAAGKGTRMQPLTRHTPKPLLMAAGKSLIEHQIDRLKVAGITDIVVNVAYLGEKIIQALGDGSELGVGIQYSEEPEPLETAGAISHALPILGEEPFVLVNGDVWCDFPLIELLNQPLGENLGRLLFVANPAFKDHGDFSLEQGKVCQCKPGDEGYTYAGIALLSPTLVADYPERRKIFPLREVFDAAIAQNKLSAQLHHGDWRDIGTVDRLEELRRDLS